MDALSHILVDIHLYGAEYLYVNGKGDHWAYACKGHPIFHVVLTGPVRLLVPDFGEFLLQSGDMAFIPNGVPHYLFHPSTTPTGSSWLTDKFNGHCNEPVYLGDGDIINHLVCFRCLLDSNMAKPLLTSLPSCMPVLQGENGAGPEWMRIGHRFLLLEARAFRPGRDTLIDRLITMMLIECVRDYVEKLPEGDNNWLSAVHDPYLSQALSAIHSRPAYPWTVAELAERACLSRSAFHGRFSQVIGKPPLTYLTEHRMRLSAKNLEQADLSIKQVSERVGYTSETAFSQAFRRHYGVSPTLYRKKLESIDCESGV